MGFLKYVPGIGPLISGAEKVYDVGKGIVDKVDGSNDSTQPSDEYKKLVESGLAAGRKRGEELYGITPSEVGQEAKTTRGMRKDRLTGADPATTSLRESRNRRIRMARARGASPEEITQIERQAESDIGREEERRSGKRLSEYERSLTGAIRGTTGTELGYGQLYGAGQSVQLPESSGGILGDLGGTVICTELHRQGYMPDEILIKDRAYGAATRRDKPHVYFGYRFLAAPVVKIMNRSQLFTKLISYPAMAWANNMAGNHNISGKIISIIGEFVCGTVGRLINMEKRYGIQGTKIKA